MSIIKSLEFIDNPKVTIKRQNTPNMLLLLWSVLCFICYLHTFDRAVRTGQRSCLQFSAYNTRVESDPRRRRNVCIEAFTKREITLLYNPIINLQLQSFQNKVQQYS